MINAKGATALSADGERALRTELEWLLGDAWPELVVTASVGDGASALEAVGRLQPDVAFLDTRLPPPAGLEVARRVGAGTAIVFVTAYRQSCRRGVRAGGHRLSSQAGALGRVHLVRERRLADIRRMGTSTTSAAAPAGAGPGDANTP